MTDVLALDLGGTRLKAGAVDVATGTVSGYEVVDSAPEADAALDRVADVGRRLLAAHACGAVGLAVPGIVEAEGTIVALPGKLAGIVGRDLMGWLRQAFSLPALVVNDAIAFGVGEARYGAARGHARAVIVTIGTGIGVSVIEHGLPATEGALGGGLLGGQIPIADDPAGPVDTNGRSGTIEALCRAQRIVECANACGGRFATVPAVFEAVAGGDEPAQRGVALYRHQLTRALVALAHAHAPSIIVVGGGPMVPDNPVLPGLQALVDAQLWPGYRVAIAIASAERDAALQGVARLASVRTAM